MLNRFHKNFKIRVKKPAYLNLLNLNFFQLTMVAVQTLEK